jgi:hypothetical protein
MPSGDLILNVKQIAGYPSAGNAIPSDAIVIQRGGLGGAYMSIDAPDFVGTALASGGEMAIGGQLLAGSIQAGSVQFSNAAVGLLNVQQACLVNLEAINGSLGGAPIATVAWVTANTVASWNGRTGAVIMTLNDILGAGGAPLLSPQFYGSPAAPTPAPGSNNANLATTAFVQNAIANLIPLDSPAFTGTPTAPTPPIGPTPPTDNSTTIATTAFVVGVVNQLASQVSTLYAPLASPNFSGLPTAPTAAPGTTDGQLATTAFVMAAVTASTTGVSSFNSRTGAVVLDAADLTAAGGALLASPAFTGTPSAPTANTGNASGILATTQFVQNAVAALNVGVTSFNTRSGVVTLTAADITAAGGALAVDAGVTTFNGRSGAITLTTNDVSAAGGVAANSPALTGVPTAPTATPSTLSTTQIATTAFVQAALAGGVGVASFNGRAGAVTLIGSDITGASGALLASPVFTGVPRAPTPAVADNSTTLATTAFVMAAVAASTSGVSSFNTRTGAVVLTSADITNAGGALAGGVTSFNSRTGAVTLIANDISAAGGAPLASPALTGVPTAPTAAANTSTTQLATCAFVTAAISSLNIGAYLPLAGGTVTGALTVNGTFTNGPGGVIGGVTLNSSSVNVPQTVAATAITLAGNGVAYHFGQGNSIGFGWMPGSVLHAFVDGSDLGQIQFVASDRRLKSNIQPSSFDALGALNALPVRSCDLKMPRPDSPLEHWDCSLIADEVERLIPIAYSPASRSGEVEAYASLRLLPLVATLVRAVQQLTARLVDLETRMAT